MRITGLSTLGGEEWRTYTTTGSWGAVELTLTGSSVPRWWCRVRALLHRLRGAPPSPGMA